MQVCAWLQVSERRTTREGEGERHGRGLTLNGQTQSLDVLVHVVPLASSSNTPGFFKFGTEVAAAACLFVLVAAVFCLLQR